TAGKDVGRQRGAARERRRPRPGHPHRGTEPARDSHGGRRRAARGRHARPYRLAGDRRHALRGRHDFRRDRELDAAAPAPRAVAAALEKGTEMTESRTKPAALNNPIVLAFSGGLDTSFCVPWLKETYGRDVVTATVNTGGIDA